MLNIQLFFINIITLFLNFISPTVGISFDVELVDLRLLVGEFDS